MDLDKDGSLSKDEIQKAGAQLGDFFNSEESNWGAIITKCDLDGDGKIDFQEFFTAAVDHQKLMTKENIQLAFNTFDTNGDGKIEIDEFRSALPKNIQGNLKPVEGLQKGKHAAKSEVYNQEE